MTPELDELERLAKAATPGPWWEEDLDGEGFYWSIHAGTKDGPDELVLAQADGLLEEHEDRANFRFIAAANPQTVLELIARARLVCRLIQQNAEMAERLRGIP